MIERIKFKIRINDTAYENYLRLMRFSIILLKKNLFKILSNNYKSKKQKLSNGSYYSKSSINYKKIIKFNVKNFTIKKHNKIRSLIFPAYQFPIVNGTAIAKSIYKIKKVYLIKSSDYKLR